MATLPQADLQTTHVSPEHPCRGQRAAWIVMSYNADACHRLTAPDDAMVGFVLCSYGPHGVLTMSWTATPVSISCP